MYPVTFVSLGPGDPELITLKSLKSLQNADCIFYPTIVTKQGAESSRSFNIMKDLDIDTSKMMPFMVPMSKNRTSVLKVYEEVAQKLAENYKQNKRVAIVAEGDAGFYSTTQHVYDCLIKNNIPTDRIAGIPAFIACGTLANLHIVKLEEELHVVPGVIESADLQQRLKDGRVIAIMKTSLCEEAIKDCIKNLPEATYHYFENVGVEGREFYTQETDNILNRKFPYFSLMIIQN